MEDNKVIGNIVAGTDNSGRPILKSTQNIFCNSYYFQDFYDESLIKKFIKSTESLIRHSREYTDYLALLKTNYNILNYDNLQSNISDADASIEIHHYPFTLYEIVDIVMTYHTAKKEDFTSFSLAEEIMDLHFKHKIGFVPLTTTNHELAHDNGVFISFKQVFGNWEDFCNTYKEGISQETIEKIEHLRELSDAKMASDFKGLF